MSVLAFNTLEFADRLKAAGVPTGQAEAQARAMAEVLANSREDLATNADLRDLKSDLRELRAEIHQLRTEVGGKFMLLQWMLGVTVAGVIALVMKAFMHA